MRDQLLPVLPSGYSRVKGEDVRRLNIMVATNISDIVKTMLGPKGMSKMLMAVGENPVITNDAKTVLDKMNLLHPIAKTFVNIAKMQDMEVGDGTKIAVIFAGQLLKNAERLLDQRVHPTIVIRGYGEATKRALTVLKKNAIEASINDEETLKKIAKTVLARNTIGIDRLADFIVLAVKQVADVEDGNLTVDVDYVGIRGKSGGNVGDSMLIKGLIIHKERPHILMPKKIEGAKIALVECSLDPLTQKATEWRKEYVVKSPGQLRSFIQKERSYTKSMVEKVKLAGANVLFCRKTISDSMLRCLAQEGILALYLVAETDMVRLARAVGAKIVSNINDLKKGDLGEAGLIEFRKIADDEILFINHCKNPRAVTIILRGGTEHIVEELKKTVRKSLKATATVIEDRKFVAGGGAIEVELAKTLREFSKAFKGKEKLAVIAFADAIETIAETLAANAGLNKVDVLTELKTKHAQGAVSLGINVFKGKIVDTVNEGILDAFRVKEHAIKVGNEIATMVLRIDDVISAAKRGKVTREERGKRRERQRVQMEELRRFFKEEEGLKKIERELKGRASSK